MAFWLWTAVAGCVLAAVGAACLSFVRVRVRYSRSGQLDQLVVIVHGLFGLFRYRLEVPTIRIVKSGVSFSVKEKTAAAGTGREQGQKGRLLNKKSIQRLRRLVRDLLRSARGLKGWALTGLKKIECTRYRLDIRIGTGDAALTGTATGLCWAVLGIAEGLVARLVKLRTHPHGSVAPVYSGTELSIVWEADFRIRAGTALAHALRLLPRLHVRAALRGLQRARALGRT